MPATISTPVPPILCKTNVAGSYPVGTLFLDVNPDGDAALCVERDGIGLWAIGPLQGVIEYARDHGLTVTPRIAVATIFSG